MRSSTQGNANKSEEAFAPVAPPSALKSQVEACKIFALNPSLEQILQILSKGGSGGAKPINARITANVR